MAETALAYRWTRDEFVRAWEAGVFDRRVEFVDGEVWPVVIGLWHGDTSGRLSRALPAGSATITMATLPAGESLPDPDCWVRRTGAEPIETIGSRLAAWDPADVLLVVEVADETVAQDLGTKAAIYAQAGYGCYWVVTKEALYEHIDPTPAGYRSRTVYRSGESVPVRYAGIDLPVADLIGVDPG